MKEEQKKIVEEIIPQFAKYAYYLVGKNSNGFEGIEAIDMMNIMISIHMSSLATCLWKIAGAIDDEEAKKVMGNFINKIMNAIPDCDIEEATGPFTVKEDHDGCCH